MSDGSAVALALTSDEVSEVVTPELCVDAVREGYADRGRGAPAEPRTTLFGDEPPGMLTGYLAILPEVGAMGAYVYAAGFGGRDAHFTLPLFDATTGDPLAVLDGASLNPYKTGAAGAVGADALARDDATHVGIFGSGPQARGQLRSLATVRDVARVAVYSPTRDHRETFATEMDERLGADVRAVDRPSEALAGTDVVVTATDATEPVFDGDDLEPGTHVTAMGQYHPEKRELDATTIQRATYVPDLRERVTRDAGSFLHALEAGVVDEAHVHAELGEVVAGVEPGRTSEDEISVFDSGGTAIETVAAGYAVYREARERGLGREIEFAPASEALTGR